MALFRTSAKDGVSLPFVFQSAQSASTAPLVGFSFRNRDDDSGQVYRIAAIDVYDSGALSGDSTKDGFGTMVISTASNGEVSEVIRFTDENYVGVGTASPCANLHVVGSARFDGGAFAVSNGAVEFENTDVRIAGGSLTVNGREVPGGGVDGGALSYDEQTGLLTIGTAGAPRVYVTGDGSVGVGTSEPSCQLEVSGCARTGDLVVDGGASIGPAAADPRYALRVSGDVFVDGAVLSSPSVFESGPDTVSSRTYSLVRAWEHSPSSGGAASEIRARCYAAAGPADDPASPGFGYDLRWYDATNNVVVSSGSFSNVSWSNCVLVPSSGSLLPSGDAHMELHARRKPRCQGVSVAALKRYHSSAH